MLFGKNKDTKGISHIIVGLGNIGDKYDNTRHNIGFRAVDKICEELSAPVARIKFNSLITNSQIEEFKVVLIKPTTYMNLSGKAVLEVSQFYKIAPEKIIVFSDDTTMEIGSIRIRAIGSHGGHNGLRDISNTLGTENYPRIRLGVGTKPHPSYDLSDWVLGKFSEADNKELETVLKDTKNMVYEIMKNGVPSAQNKYGKTIRPPKGSK